jgi:inosose dehydratase
MEPMQMDRRQWLQAAGAGSIFGALGTASTYSGAAAEPAGRIEHIAAQAYVFSQHHGRRGEQLRDFVGPLFSAHADAGIFQLELLADLLAPDGLATLRGELQKTGIRVPAVYTGCLLWQRDAHEKSIEAATALAGRAARVGARFLNCNPDPKPRKQRKTDDELATEADGIRRLAEAVRAEGLTLLLHQHDAEMAEDARNWRYWLRHTDARDVRVCFDTHWAFRAGQDVLALLRECQPRLESLHLRNSRKGVWWECLDDGDLDYRPIAVYLQQARYQGLLTVELAWETGTAHTRNLTDNLRLSRQYAERRFLAGRS